MRRYVVQISGTDRSVEVEHRADGRVRARIEGSNRWLEASLDGTLMLDAAGRTYRVEAIERGGQWVVQVGDATCTATVEDEARHRLRGRRRLPPAADGAEDVRAPMPGRVVRIVVKAGDAVVAGQALVVVEAMKMENEIRSAGSGTVRDIAVREGQTVETGERLVTIEALALGNA